MKIKKSQLRKMIREATKAEGASTPEMDALEAAVEAYAAVNGWPAVLNAIEGLKVKARKSRVAGIKRSQIQGTLAKGKSKTAFFTLSDTPAGTGTGKDLYVAGYVLNPKHLRKLADALRKLSSGDMAPAAGQKVRMDIT